MKAADLAIDEFRQDRFYIVAVLLGDVAHEVNVSGGVGAASFGVCFLGDDDVSAFTGRTDGGHQSAYAVAGHQDIALNGSVDDYNHRLAPMLLSRHIPGFSRWITETVTDQFVPADLFFWIDPEKQHV